MTSKHLPLLRMTTPSSDHPRQNFAVTTVVAPITPPRIRGQPQVPAAPLRHRANVAPITLLYNSVTDEKNDDQSDMTGLETLPTMSASAYAAPALQSLSRPLGLNELLLNGRVNQWFDQEFKDAKAAGIDFANKNVYRLLEHDDVFDIQTLIDAFNSWYKDLTGTLPSRELFDEHGHFLQPGCLPGIWNFLRSSISFISSSQGISSTPPNWLA